MADKINLVTGANGHLGNNLVRALLKKGHNVRAGIRNLNDIRPFEGLDCELTYTELMEETCTNDAMEGVDTLYHVAAVFKHWSPNPEKEIIQANLKMTQNVLSAAAKRKVRRIVFVSSMSALDHDSLPMDESTWNKKFYIPYYQAKTDAERLAWRLAKDLNLWMVSVLPSSMVGPNCFGELNTTMNLLTAIVKNQIPIDPGFSFNYVDVGDVASGMISAAEKGRNGERYILGSEQSTTTRTVMEIARELFPGTKVPEPISKADMIKLAEAMEKEALLTGNAPQLQLGHIKTYYGRDQSLNITKARNDLGFDPKSPEEALKQAFRYIAIL